ncbi:MAG: methyl-accepting chemotaxis protein [Comamonas sp.]|nr:methyl-accepting chemotaxis protein [Comamonas sp.]
MRLNLPVTQNHHDYSGNELLVSSTDLKGDITHCNAAFQRVSGYEMHELIGQPHSIIRHPDVPPEAFRDLWRTIGRGRPWTGLVKNRRKNGDYYWVRANVTPIMANGKPREYLSVRTKPSAEEIAAAEGLYAQMREASSQGRTFVEIVHGRVYRPGWRGRVQRLMEMGINKRLMLWLVALLGCVLLPDLLGMSGTSALAARIALFVLGAGALLWHFQKSCVEGLEAAERCALDIAGGNLTTPVENPYHGSLGQLMHCMQQIQVNLRAVVGDIRVEIRDFNATTQDIARGSDDLAHRVEVQVQGLQHTTEAMDSIALSVAQTDDITNRMRQHSQHSSHISAQGSQTIQAVAQAMDSIRSSSARMGEITSTIESIAFQTNLLALNAAVEAARAGEQGRGFAVVATEVRTLAQRSANAAQEISALIAQALQGINEGHQRMQQADTTIGRMVQATAQVDGLIQEISQASQAQNEGVQQVSATLNQLDQMTQQNAALAQESSAAAQMLHGSIHGLERSVGVFTF